MEWYQAVIVFAVAFAVAYCMVPVSKKIAFRIGAIDYPGYRRMNREPCLLYTSGAHGARCGIAHEREQGLAEDQVDGEVWDVEPEHHGEHCGEHDHHEQGICLLYTSRCV